MIRNIPYHYTQDQFVGELSYLGFTSLCYDFLHLPSSKGKRSNVGYAFVNFKGAHVVQALKEALESIGSMTCVAPAANRQACLLPHARDS